ncbi:MAG TPA: hypothetical protein VLE02_01075 [Nitrosarchaeum sp.]|nr:hypothetical protein [Nitrosarchaeum sp.]
MSVEEIKIKPFDFDMMPLSCTLIAIGSPGSGKTTLIENIVYYKKHLYPTARVFICNEGGYKKLCKIFGSLFVSNNYNEDEHKNAIIGQKKRSMIHDGNNPAKFSVIIADDLNQKFLRSNLMTSVHKVGTQHWNCLSLVGTQCAFDCRPEIRSSVSYVALFRCVDENEKKKLYTNFGGICGSYEKFCSLLDNITGDHRCMIIKKMSQSNNIEDNIFWYETKVMKEWKFGCTEFRKWNTDRYNVNYVEKFDI